MLTEIEIVKKYVHLTGYGRSEDWVGYCERNKAFTFDIADQIINVFFSYFYDNSISIVSSLVKVKNHIIDYDLKLASKLIIIENKLISENYLELVEEEDLEDVEVYDHSKFISRPEFKFFGNITKETIKTHSILKFIDSSIDGHCFFILKNQKMIAYPHNDTGFGFFNYGNKKKIDPSFYKFMNEVNLMENFNAIIKN